MKNLERYIFTFSSSYFTAIDLHKSYFCCSIVYWDCQYWY